MAELEASINFLLLGTEHNFLVFIYLSPCYPLQQLPAIQGITSTFVLAFAIDNWAFGWLCLLS